MALGLISWIIFLYFVSYIIHDILLGYNQTITYQAITRYKPNILILVPNQHHMESYFQTNKHGQSIYVADNSGPLAHTKILNFRSYVIAI